MQAVLRVLAASTISVVTVTNVVQFALTLGIMSFLGNILQGDWAAFPTFNLFLVWFGALLGVALGIGTKLLSESWRMSAAVAAIVSPLLTAAFLVSLVVALGGHTGSGAVPLFVFLWPSFFLLVLCHKLDAAAKQGWTRLWNRRDLR